MTPAVDIRGVWKFYGDFPALRDITLQINEGDCVALLGRNGAGKTTLLRVAAGLLRPAKGSVEIHGGIGWLGHGIGVYEELSAYENLVVFGQLPTNGLSGPGSTGWRTGWCGSTRGACGSGWRWRGPFCTRRV
jgi:ABC-type multidrug transport system ATPase subunit